MFWVHTHATFQEADKQFEVYTYNMSLVELLDEDKRPETRIQTSYNWDTKEEEWIDGKGGPETVEFSCMAYGGRPEPEIRWYIGNNNNDDLTNEDNFNVRTTRIGTGFGNYITDFRSTIDFQIDDNLMDLLQR